MDHERILSISLSLSLILQFVGWHDFWVVFVDVMLCASLWVLNVGSVECWKCNFKKLLSLLIFQKSCLQILFVLKNGCFHVICKWMCVVESPFLANLCHLATPKKIKIQFNSYKGYLLKTCVKVIKFQGFFIFNLFFLKLWICLLHFLCNIT